MGCNTCNEPIASKKVLKVVELSRVLSDNCGNTTNEILYPETVLQAIKDPCTQESLLSILGSINHVYAPFKGSFRETISTLRNKRRGLVITTTNNEGEVFHKVFVGENTTDKEWNKESNWVDFAKGTSDTPINPNPTIPSDLISRIESLENREDEDTIFNPTGLLEEIESLKREIAALKEADASISSNITKLQSRPDIKAVSGEFEGEDIKINLSDGTHFYIRKGTPEPPKPIETPKKIFYGYNRVTAIDDPYATVNDLTESTEANPGIVDITFGEASDEFGYWGVTIDKEILPSVSKVEMFINDTWYTLNGGYNLLEDNKDGKPVWFIQDTELNGIERIRIRVS